MFFFKVIKIRFVHNLLILRTSALRSSRSILNSSSIFLNIVLNVTNGYIFSKQESNNYGILPKGDKIDKMSSVETFKPIFH